MKYYVVFVGLVLAGLASANFFGWAPFTDESEKWTPDGRTPHSSTTHRFYHK